MLSQWRTVVAIALAAIGCVSFAECAESSGGVAKSALAEPVLVDRWGIEHAWSVDLSTLPNQQTRGFAVVFLDTKCPIVTRIAPRLNELADKYLEQKIQFIGVYPNESVTRLAMASHSQKLDLSFPVFMDVDGLLARHLKARATPEVFLLDAQFKTRYRGMIDDSGWKKSPTQQATNYLADAIDGLLTGKPFLAETRAQGCVMQLPPWPRQLPKESLTYYDHVGPLLNQHCVSCHYPGGIGGFPLHDFASVKLKASTIRREVAFQRMPPWQSDVTRGRKVHGALVLSDDDRQKIVNWIDQGLARQEQGEAEWLVAGKKPSQPLALPVLPKPGEFTIGGGKPDYVLTMTQPFVVKASQTVEYQYFWIPNDFKEDKYVQELELLPGDRRVVHHIQVFVVNKKDRPQDTSKPITGVAMMSKLYGISGEGQWRIASYTPGDQFSTRRYKPNEGILVPAGFDLMFEMHYTPIDEDVSDRTSIGFVWRKDPSPPEHVLYDHIFTRDRSIELPPHTGHQRTEFAPYFKQDAVLIDVRPHMHLRGADYQLTITYPDGREELLVAIPAYDFNWQRRYLFTEPVKVPAGSTLKVVGHWDNSRLHPYNPDPNATVIFGEESANEMSNLVVTYMVDKDAAAARTRTVRSAIVK
jgi:hypothetical protein